MKLSKRLRQALKDLDALKKAEAGKYQAWRGPCLAPHPKGGYLCTLKSGHAGKHQAKIGTGRLVADWPQQAGGGR